MTADDYGQRIPPGAVAPRVSSRAPRVPVGRRVDQAADPATAAGVTLGALHRGIEEFFQRLAQGFRIGLASPSRLTPEQRLQRREVLAIRHHQELIRTERLLGLAFVRAEARRVRRELGLEQDRRHL